MATELAPYDNTAFNQHPNRKPKDQTRAERGLCSHQHSYGPYHATYMLVVDGKARFALCPLHTRLWQTRKELGRLRDLVYQDLGDTGLRAVLNGL